MNGFAIAWMVKNCGSLLRAEQESLFRPHRRQAGSHRDRVNFSALGIALNLVGAGLPAMRPGQTKQGN